MAMSDWKRIEDPVAAGNGKKTDKPAPAREEITAVPVPQETAEPEQEAAVPESPAAEVRAESKSSSAAPVSPAANETPADTSREENSGTLAAVPEISEDAAEIPVIRSPRYTKKGRRKGRHWYAAPLGLLVLLLALVGLISLIVTGVGAIRKAQDDTPLRQELESFLSPVMQYCPTPFSDINDEPQDTLLLASIWRVSKAEYVRMLREGSDVSQYPSDDLWRMMIPVSEIEESYHYLYGPDAEPIHRSIEEGSEDFSIEYDVENDCYHVPLMTTVSSNYTPVLDTVKRKGDTVTVRVAYVSNTDIAIDDDGNPVTPTPDQAKYAQIYTVVQNGDGWALTSIAGE